MYLKISQGNFPIVPPGCGPACSVNQKKTNENDETNLSHT